MQQASPSPIAPRPAQPRPLTPGRAHLLALAGFLLLSLLLTWPLLPNLTTHVPGDGIDDPALAWNLWWVKYAAVDRQVSLFDSRWMFHPVGINLAFYTLTVSNGLLATPLQIALIPPGAPAHTGIIVAYNLLLLSSFTLSGYGAFLLARDQLRHAPGWFGPAFLAGAIYAFASSKLFYAALGQGNIASSQWIPFCALYLARLGRAPTMRQALRNGALAGLFLLLQLWVEMTFASFLTLLGAFFGLRWLSAVRWTPAARQLLARRSAGLIALALTTALGALPLLAAMLPDLRAEGNFFASGGGFADIFSADLAGFLWPVQMHPLFGAAARAAPFPHDKGQHIFIGFSVLSLAALGLLTGRRRPATRFWALATCTFFLLTLGPTLRLGGQDTGIPGPFALLSRVPFFDGNRYPSRFSVMLMLGLALLAAQGLSTLLLRLRRPDAGLGRRGAALALGSLLLVLGEHLAVPLPLNNLAQVPAVYQTLAALPGDFAVLEIPPGWRNGARVLGKQDTLIMAQQWFQALHHKRLLGGNTSRNPPFKFQFFTQAPVLSTLIALTNAADQPAHTRLRSILADPTAWQQLLDQDRRAAHTVLRQLDIRYIVLHEASAPANVISYVESVLPVQLQTVQDGVRLYAVTLPTAPAPVETRLNGPLATLYLGEGWSGWLQEPVLGAQWNQAPQTAVWAERQRSRLLLPAPPAGEAARLELEMAAAGPGQTLRVRLNGWQSASMPLATGWQTISLQIPAQAVQPGVADVILEFGKLYPLRLESGISAHIGMTGVAAPVSIYVESAGEESGDFAHIWVNGRDAIGAQAGEPGYFAVVIERETGRIETVRHFDTLADAAAAEVLAQFIASLPAGQIVAVAAADEASLALSAEAIAAFNSIGAQGDLRDHFRWGHAIIGVKGAAPGQAVEALGAVQPATAAVGGAWRSPRLAAALRRIAWGSS